MEDFDKRQVTIFCFEHNGHREPVIVANIAENSRAVKNIGYVGFRELSTQVYYAGHTISIFAMRTVIQEAVVTNIHELTAIHNQAMSQNRSVFVRVQGKAASFFVNGFPCIKYSMGCPYFP